MYTYDEYDKAITGFAEKMKQDRINELKAFAEIEKNNAKKEEEK